MKTFCYLLLDDDIALTETLARALTRRQQKVTSSNTLSELAELLQNQHFDRAVVDLKMGEGNGLEAIQHIRQAQPHCEIVMLTGYASIVTAVEAIKRGAIQYLPKPVDVQEIMNAFSGENLDRDLVVTTPSVERLEWEHIQRVLHENTGNISATARALNMHRRTLQRKLAKNPLAR